MGADTKAFMIVLKNLIRPYVNDGFFEIPQFAYRTNASTQDALLRGARHCRDVRESVAQVKSDLTSKFTGMANTMLCGGLMISLDLAKAFDSLTYPEMYASLRECNVPDEISWLLVEVHRQTVCDIRHGGVTGSTRMHRGLRQGCPAAPLIYVGLSAAPNVPDSHLPLHGQLDYLGATLSYTAFEQLTFDKRAKQAWITFHRLRPALRTQGPLSLGQRIRIFKVFVMPTLMYGIAFVGITQHVARGLIRTLSQMLRKVLRIHEHGVSNQAVLQRAQICPDRVVQDELQNKQIAISKDTLRCAALRDEAVQQIAQHQEAAATAFNSGSEILVAVDDAADSFAVADTMIGSVWKGISPKAVQKEEAVNPPVPPEALRTEAPFLDRHAQLMQVRFSEVLVSSAGARPRLYFYVIFIAMGSFTRTSMPPAAHP
ncbi:unnamed protein product [Symbiodinium sp. CCMP2456]|nr:unnamed protein product [Symbiodinium sp. CCMP2456]